MNALHVVKEASEAPATADITDTKEATSDVPDGSILEETGTELIIAGSLDKTEGEIREELLAEFRQLATVCSYTEQVIKHAEALEYNDLVEYVRLQRKLAGGSIEAAELIAAVEESFLEIMDSEVVNRKIAALEQRGKDFVVTAQKLSSVLGQDVVINGLKFKDYHELLKHCVSHVHVLDSAISRIAAVLGIRIPVDFLNTSRGYSVVIPDQVMSEKASLFVLEVLNNNLKFYINHAENVAAAYTKARQQVNTLTTTIERVLERTEAREADLLRERAEVQRALASTASFVLKCGSYYLGKIDPEAKLSKSNIDLYENIADAMFIPSKAVGNDIARRIKDRPKFKDARCVRLVETEE